MMNPESVAEKFILANCYNPKAAGAMLRRECSTEFAESGFQDRGIPVPDIKKPDPAWVRENPRVNDSYSL
ncbi:MULTISPECIES: hypothetical protein [Spirulina]|uniref:hypothetical protein n=1 Tax=Spirulina TaxID=1154 RepID=UPI00232ADC34|nr:MULTISPECIES: hypothetical protein [Spirulina]